MTTIAKKKTASSHQTPNHGASVGAPATATHAPEVAGVAPPTLAPTPPGAVPLQLQALEQACGYGDPLSDAVRTTSEELVRRIPSSIIERILALAVRGGGVVAGIAFDPTAARSALAEADEAAAVATAALMLARRAQDQATRLRAGVAGDASAIRIAMHGYAKTKQGKSLAPEIEAIRALAKQHAAARKARNTRAKNAVTAATPPAPAPAPTAETPAPTHAPAVTPTAS